MSRSFCSARRPLWMGLAALALAAGLLSSGGQLRSQQPTFSSHVKVVEVPATVRDKHKQIVRNLTEDDFILEEDGRPQAIRYFNEDTNVALTLGLLVDTSY